jgi:hypothetical protein
MALPGIRCADHFGIAAPDIGAATRSFVGALRAEAFLTGGPFGTGDARNPSVAEHPGVNARAVIKALGVLRLASGRSLELLESAAPPPQRSRPRKKDAGGYDDDFHAPEQAGIRRLRTPKHPAE